MEKAVKDKIHELMDKQGICCQFDWFEESMTELAEWFVERYRSIENNNIALVKKCDEYRDEYTKTVKEKGERIKELQMRLDRAEEKIAEMVESHREFLDV